MSINLTLNKVRVSYPHLFKAQVYKADKGKDPKFSVVCLLHPKKNKKDLEAIEDAIEELIEAEFKGKRPKGMRVILKDGNDKTDDDDNVADGYEDHMYLKASSKKKPTVVDRDLTPVTEEDNAIYGGCYCNVSIRIYAQNNDYGKHINVTLRGVQKVSDGERFGDAGFDAEKEFKDLSDDDDDDRPKKGKKSKKRSRDEDEDNDDIL